MSYFPVTTPRGNSSQPVAPRVGLASSGTAWWSGYQGTLTRTVYVMPVSTGGATDIQIVVGNWSPAAAPEANTNGLSTSACLEYNGQIYWLTWGGAGAGVQPNSVFLQGGGRAKSDPLPVFIPAGASYAIRKLDLAPPPSLTASISGGAVTSITINSQGVGGWTQPPAVTLTGGGYTTAATATAIINAAGQITGFNISGGAGYASAPTVTVNTQVPVGRNCNAELGEFWAYYTPAGPCPTTPFGADLLTSAATAASGTVLTFATTSVTAFNNAALATGAVLNAPGLLPGTKVTAITATTLTFSPASLAAIAAGTTIRVLANRSVNTNGGNGPLNILGRVVNRSAAVIIFGDSIAAGKNVTGSLATSAAAASGTNVLTFASTTLAGVIMCPGLELPVYPGVNSGVPSNAVVGAITGTTVTLVNAFTGAAANLTSGVASGTTITFGRPSDAIGNIGYIEKGLVNFYGTAAVAPAMPFCNMALSGDTLRSFSDLANGMCRMSILGDGWTHVIDEYSINDYLNGNYTTLAAYQSAKLAFWAVLASYSIKVIACTILTETTSTDGWVTAGNQTAKAAGFAFGALESQGNDWIRAQVAAGVLWDVIDAADAQMTARNSQVWGAVSLSNGGTMTAYPMTVDGVHPVGPGQAPLAALVAAKVAAGVFS